MNKRLLIATPARGGLPHYYMTLHEQLIRQGVPGWDVDYLIEGAQNSVQISRNVLAQQAIVRNYDRVLFLDSDMLANIGHVIRILSHDVPIVSGLYCMKRPGKPFFLGIRKKGAVADANHLLEAVFLPTGFLSVDVNALRTISAQNPDREFYVEDQQLLPPGPKPTRSTMTEFFPTEINGPRTPQARMRRVKEAMAAVMEKGVAGSTKPMMIETLQNVINALTSEQEPGHLTGEDYAFCALAYRAGIKMYLDTACMVAHEGKIGFPITNPAFLTTSVDAIPELEGDVDKW